MDACEQTSEDESDTWEAEDDRFEGSLQMRREGVSPDDKSTRTPGANS